MCGRFTLVADPSTIQARFRIMVDRDHQPHYNIAPPPMGADRQHPSGSARGRADALGVGAVLGQGPHRRQQDDQRPRRDGGGTTLFPGGFH